MKAFYSFYLYLSYPSAKQNFFSNTCREPAISFQIRILLSRYIYIYIPSKTCVFHPRVPSTDVLKDRMCVWNIIDNHTYVKTKQNKKKLLVSLSCLKTLKSRLRLFHWIKDINQSLFYLFVEWPTLKVLKLVKTRL